MKIVGIEVTVAVEGWTPEHVAELTFVVNPAMPALTEQMVDAVVSTVRDRLKSTVQRIEQEGGPQTREAAFDSDHSVDEADCPGHVASAHDPKICGRCGVSVDELRPDDADPINLAGSGPVPI